MKQPVNVKKAGSKAVKSAKKNVKNARRKAILLRAVVLVVTVLLLLALILGILAIIRGCVRKQPLPEAPAASALDVNGKNYINYYEPDYTADIFKDQDYLACDRSLHYFVSSETGGYGYVLGEYDEKDLTEGGRFFLRYFDAVTHGDCDAYHTFFTDEYIDDPIGSEKHPADRVFPMQRVYDVTIKELTRTAPGDTTYMYRGENVVYGVYEVSYKILKNDGEFRVDLPQGGAVPVIFELMTENIGTENERTRIRGIYRRDEIGADK